METHFRKILTNLMCQKYLRLDYDGVAHRAFYFLLRQQSSLLESDWWDFFHFILEIQCWVTLHDWNSKNVLSFDFSGISSRSEVMSLKARLCLKRSAMTTKYYHCGTAKLSQKSIKWIRHRLSESSIGPTVLMHSNHYTMQF